MNIERTLPTFSSDTKPIDGSWQIVNGTRFKFFVFSAFYDRRAGKLIRIIGATKTRVPEKVWCRFVYNTGNATAPTYRSVSVMARVKVKTYFIDAFNINFNYGKIQSIHFMFHCLVMIDAIQTPTVTLHCTLPASVHTYRRQQRRHNQSYTIYWFRRVGDTRKLEFKIQCMLRAVPSNGARRCSSLCS